MMDGILVVIVACLVVGGLVGVLGMWAYGPRVRNVVVAEDGGPDPTSETPKHHRCVPRATPYLHDPGSGVDMFACTVEGCRRRFRKVRREEPAP